MTTPFKERPAFPASALIGLAAVLGWCVTIISGYPGYINWDEWYELGNIFTHALDDVHPPMQTVAWKFLIDVFQYFGWGPSLQYASALLVQTTLFWTAAAVFATKFRSYGLAVIFLFTLAVHPTLLAYLCHIGKDTQMAEAIFVAFALLYLAIERRSGVFLALSLLFMFYGFTVRSNGPVAVLPLCLLWGNTFLRITRTNLQSWKGKIVLAFMSLAVFTGLMVANEMLYKTVIVKKAARGVAGAITLWEDMKGISVRINKNIVPSYLYADPNYSLENIKKTYIKEGCDFTGLRGIISPELARTLMRDWLKAVIKYPVPYIQHRLFVMKYFWGYHGEPQNYAIFTGFHGGTNFPHAVNPPENSKELMRSVEDLDPLLVMIKLGFRQYFQYFKDSVLARPWAYVLLFVTCFLFLGGEKKNLLSRIAVYMGASAACYFLPYIPLSSSASLRYVWWSELAVVAIFFFLLDETLGRGRMPVPTGLASRLAKAFRLIDNTGERKISWLNPAVALFGGFTALGLLAGYLGIWLFVK